MIVLLAPLAGALGLGLARRRRRSKRSTHAHAHPVGRIGACCRACAHDQAAGRMPVGATCSPCALHHGPGHGPIRCAAPPFWRGAVDEQIAVLYRRGATPDEAAIAVLEAVYPATPEGQRIPWRSLSAGDAPWLADLQRRVRARVLYGFALEALALASEAEAKASAHWTRTYGDEIA